MMQQLKGFCLIGLALLCSLTALAQGIAGLPKGGTKSLIRRSHVGYDVAYDTSKLCPVWVAWRLTASRLTKEAERNGSFKQEPDLKHCTATHADYTKSGYDRGHMCPAADNAWSATAMTESFFTTNICPQLPRLNRGTWKTLEEEMRRKTLDGDTLFIVCGPIFNPKVTHAKIGKNGVSVPESFYKVVYYRHKGKSGAVGFIFSNLRDKSLEPRHVTVDLVERVTGLDFFPNLPDDEEQRVESQIDRQLWP